MRFVFRDEQGSASAEYALIFGLMGGALVIATLKLGSIVSHQMTNAAHEIRSHNATSAAPSGEAEPNGKSKGKGKGKGKGQFK